MKQAKITCPHCGGGITVRQSETADERNLWAAADEMFKAMDEMFAKFFHPIFRK